VPVALCVTTGVALSLPASSDGAGSTVGLGAALGTGTRLGSARISSLAAAFLVVMVVGGLFCVLVSLVSPQVGLRLACALACSLLIASLAGIAVLRSTAGPALFTLAIGAAGLLTIVAVDTHHTRRRP